MKETGIVRRIDELGRIVVPKEMRRVLHMSTGTPVEIRMTKEGEIVLTKYSVIAEIKDYAELVAKSLEDTLRMGVAVCDTDKIIAVSGLSKKQYIDCSISAILEKILQQKKVLMLNVKDNATMVGLVEDMEITYEGEVIVPILKDGDLVGAIVVLATRSVTMEDVKVVSNMSTYLRMILEE